MSNKLSLYRQMVGSIWVHKTKRFVLVENAKKTSYIVLGSVSSV